MKKKRVITCILICLLVGVLFSKLFSVEKIRMGITRDEALKKCSESTDYYMVRFAETNTGLMYVISEGDDKGVEVELGGNHPLVKLSNVFRTKKNEFLICGYELNAEKKTRNVSTMEEILEPYTIIVEEWEIIIPIYRDYTYSLHERMIYPKKYIDYYDLEHGDYEMSDINNAVFIDDCESDM